MRDLEQAIYDKLTADNTTALYASVGTRIWTPIMQEGVGEWRNDSKAIMFTIDPVRAHVSAATHRATVTFRCYPGTANLPQTARQIARQLFDVLQRNEGNGVMTAELVGGGQMPPEPDTGYHSYRAVYKITFSNS